MILEVLAQVIEIIEIRKHIMHVFINLLARDIIISLIPLILAFYATYFCVHDFTSYNRVWYHMVIWALVRPWAQVARPSKLSPFPAMSQGTSSSTFHGMSSKSKEQEKQCPKSISNHLKNLKVWVRSFIHSNQNFQVSLKGRMRTVYT